MISPKRVGVLVSGGLDSAILVAEEALSGHEVTPIYCREGLFWEEVEIAWLHRFLGSIRRANLRSLVELQMPLLPLVGSKHWSISGKNTPMAETADGAVYLPGRNLLLLSAAATYAAQNGITEILLASLSENPFPDATLEFFASMSKTVQLGLGAEITFRAPYRALSKKELIERWSELPLHLTFSCIHPVRGNHCGKCNKCAERRKAFHEAGVADRTRYANLPLERHLRLLT